MSLADDFPPDNWSKLLKRTENGSIIPNQKNAYICLQNDHRLRNLYAFNEMLNIPCVINSEPAPLSDTDVFHCLVYLQELMPRLSKTACADAIESYARDRPFHPLRHDLDQFAHDWDHHPRVHASAVVHLDAAMTEYNMRIWEMWLLQAVNRIYNPGCKADYMVVLEGPQGAFKSSVCEILGGEYFSDSMPEVAVGKDAQIHLLGKWIIEIPEMHAMSSKTEANHLKAFLSTTTERFRPPYGRQELVVPRQCVFIGTTNKEDYLRDETGNRRFWPLKVGKVNLDSLEHDREQLLGELVHLVKAGEPPYPDATFETEWIKAEQELRYEEDPWTPAALDFLEITTQTTVPALYKAASGASDSSRMGTLEARRIATILRRAGWKMVHTNKGNVWRQPSQE